MNAILSAYQMLRREENLVSIRKRRRIREQVNVFEWADRRLMQVNLIKIKYSNAFLFQIH